MKKILVASLAFLSLFTTFTPLAQASQVQMESKEVAIEPQMEINLPGAMTANVNFYRSFADMNFHRPAGTILNRTPIRVMRISQGWAEIVPHSGPFAGQIGFVENWAVTW